MTARSQSAEAEAPPILAGTMGNYGDTIPIPQSRDLESPNLADTRGRNGAVLHLRRTRQHPHRLAQPASA